MAGSATALYAWSQRQFYVGSDAGKVAIYQGLTNDLGPIPLSKPVKVTDIAVEDLPDFWRQQVQDLITADSRADADQRVATIRAEAQACVSARARGSECGAAGSSPSASTSSTSSPATSPGSSSSNSTTATPRSTGGSTSTGSP